MTQYPTRNTHQAAISPLDAFLPAVQSWFGETFGQPTPPQALGWPAIQRGEHTLILSPTGSGKTLAAFLWGIDQLYREALECERHETGERGERGEDERGEDERLERGEDERLERESDEGYEEGVRLLYVSPLKALNNDVERNLRAPLAGIRRVAKEQGAPLPSLSVLVRTGDTPQSVRRQMVKHPPHILITTPESLYLILTSPVAREMFSTVRTLIVDEIHTLVGNKRGAHLAVSLERVVELAGRPIQRIGLSATQRPLDEVARFLGGYELRIAERARSASSVCGDREMAPRPVTIVDAGMVKAMDLKVVTAVEDFSDLPGGSIWPAIMPEVMDLIEAHGTTLIFANSRRQAERAADRLNDLHLARQAGRGGGPEAMMEGGVVKGIGIQGTGAPGGPFKAHHGSVSREARLQLEGALKAGRLPALVGTSSLELGIDIGAVDLVVQLQSPKGVARGLQRVGRSGHLVGQTSAGRFFPTHREDLLETAAIARAMAQGDVEPTYTPQNSLDVLAQQIVAMISVQDWDVPALLDVFRRAYPYHKLTLQLYHAVLDMLSGRYPSTAFRELRPRIAWDRVHNQLKALPGSRLLAIRNGGTIPDRGSFAAYLADRKTRLGELDEEFVFETQPGDVFTLGASTWRVQEVTDDRVIVTPAPGYLPRMPFWKGDAPRRDYHLGVIYGRFRRELAQRIAKGMGAQPTDGPPAAAAVDVSKEIEGWLREEYHLDVHSARNAVRYVARQMDVLGTISSDKTIIAELFTDPLGDLRLVIHSCFGARVNSPWALALAQAFREAMGPRPGVLGPRPEVMVSDDGILFRFLETDQEPPLDLIREMGPAEARERLLVELPDSAVFGAQFRMNAARALLLPSAKGAQKRTPFWLQRLRAKDLLSVAKGFEDFPIVAETYRDCLRDVLDLAHLEEVLGGIRQGEIEVVTRETLVPSPVAGSLLYDMIAKYMYEWDQPKAERQMQALMVGRDVLSQLLDDASGEGSLPDLLRPEAVRDVDAHLQYLAEGSRARTPEELATVFLALGDLSTGEAAARSAGDGASWVEELAAAGRLVPLELPTGLRYVLPEQADSYRTAFDPAAPEEAAGDARRAILRRVLSTHGPLTRDWLLARYPWESDWLDATLQALIENGELVAGQIVPFDPPGHEGPKGGEYCDRRNLERIHRQTLALLRKEVEPVSIYAYADFLARWQHLHPAERLSGPGGLVRLLQQMRGVPAPGAIWERDLLPWRLEAYDARELEDLCGQGEVVWVGSGGRDPRRARVRFFFRGEGNLFLPPEPEEAGLSPAASEVLAFLRSEGACFFADLEAGIDLSSKALSAALVELVMGGLATNDTLQGLRGILAWGGEADAPARKPLSSLDAELSAWRKASPSGVARAERLRSRPSRARLQRASRMAARRAEQATTPRWTGRWSLVHRIGVWGREVPFEERVERQARQLLQCYGIVTRQSLEGDPEGGWDWRALYPQFQLMEMRGEVRRGYFVQGLPGVQFALPQAVERLRDWTRPEILGAADLMVVNACDPANLFGPALPGEPEMENDPARFLRIPANYVVLLRGRPVLLLETGGERLTVLPDPSVPSRLSLSPATLKHALRLVVEQAGGAERRLTLKEWNGQPILESPHAPLLEELGFRREALVYVWDG
jgi:ATP-dependent Lhr-like helicase